MTPTLPDAPAIGARIQARTLAWLSADTPLNRLFELLCAPVAWWERRQAAKRAVCPLHLWGEVFTADGSGPRPHSVRDLVLSDGLRRCVVCSECGCWGLAWEYAPSLACVPRQGVALLGHCPELAELAAAWLTTGTFPPFEGAGWTAGMAPRAERLAAAGFRGDVGR